MYCMMDLRARQSWWVAPTPLLAHATYLRTSGGIPGCFGRSRHGKAPYCASCACTCDIVFPQFTVPVRRPVLLVLATNSTQHTCPKPQPPYLSHVTPCVITQQRAHDTIYMDSCFSSMNCHSSSAVGRAGVGGERSISCSAETADTSSDVARHRAAHGQRVARPATAITPSSATKAKL